MSKESNGKIDAAIQKIMKEHNIVGLSACRVQDGKIIWAQGYGWASIEARPSNHRRVGHAAAG